MKKRKIKNYFKFEILFLGISLLLFNCQKDDFEVIQPVYDSNFKIEIINLSQIEANTTASNKLNKIIAKTSFKLSNNSAKNIYDTQYNFIVNTDYVKYIEKGDYHSYNFPITRNNPTDDKIENLLLSLNKEGGYDAYIVQYVFTKEQFANLNIENLNKVTTQFTPINFESSSLLASRLSFNCIQNYVLFCPVGGGHFEGFDHTCRLELIVTSTECGWIDSGGSSGGTLTSSETISDGTTNTNAGTGGTTSSTNTTHYNYPIISAPTFDENLEFIAGLSFIQKKRYDANKALIDNFLTQNYYSFESQYFAQSSLENNSIKYINKNFELTKKSPYNIDMSQVFDSIALPKTDSIKIANVKLVCIYEKLITSDTYKNLFVNIFGGNQDVLNVQFKVTKDLKLNGERANGLHSVLSSSTRNISTGKVEKLDILIEIDEDLLTLNSNFNIAKTILHESIHAYLTLKKYECNTTATFGLYNNEDLCMTINSYYNDFNCSGTQGQHEFMFDIMLPVFKTVFKEIGKINLTSQASIDGLSTYDLQTLNQLIGTNIPNSHMFNWDELYYYNSLPGLHKTSAFENEIQNNTEKNELYKAYKYLGKEKLSKGCN